ncbi:hypothetical protein Sjap_020171 [Stephania japonica]|uniref:Mediator of RNA polymerase II transcription subunit 6 n=1 Tax=Stephania japonica TaxID=461633 RepID=A0AAP0F5P9_9MAGN
MATTARATGEEQQQQQQQVVAVGVDMTGICFRDQVWLHSFPLDRNLVFDYFAMSPFYDPTCNNEHLRLRSIHPLDHSHLSKMSGIEYALSEVVEPHLFVFRKQKRDAPDKVTPMLTYYVLDGSIYQSPQLSSVFAARIARALHHISNAFDTLASKLHNLDNQNENQNDNESNNHKDTTIDFKELKRVHLILASLQRKLPPAPPPPPFPEGYTPTIEADKDTEKHQGAESQHPTLDPIIDQGPSKRMKLH